jgi:hypothetical protein
MSGVRRAADEFLDSLASDIAVISTISETLSQPLDGYQRLWRPAPERWGVADCFEHLIATGAAYYPRIAAAMDQSNHAPARDYAPSWFGRLFIWGAGPGSRTRIRARKMFIPPPALDDAPERFILQQKELLGLVAEARRHSLQKVKIRSPLSRLLTLSLGECLEMIVVHQKRHLGQAERILSEQQFPAAVTGGTGQVNGAQRQ